MTELCPTCEHPKNHHTVVDGGAMCLHDGNDLCDCNRFWTTIQEFERRVIPRGTRTYLSGPLGGLPEVTREEKVARFKRASEVVRQMGLDPLDPNDIIASCGIENCGDVNGHTWDCWLRWDLVAMLQECDAIAMLPGWEFSKGAKLELHIARELGWPVIYLTDNEYILGGV